MDKSSRRRSYVAHDSHGNRPANCEINGTDLKKPDTPSPRPPPRTATSLWQALCSSPAGARRSLSTDRFLVLFELPLCSYLASQPILIACSRGGIGRAACLACTMPALTYWLACVGHALLLALKPQAAMKRRTLLWGARLDVMLLLLQLSNAMLQSGTPGIERQLPPLRGLMLLSAKWGLLDLGDRLFFRTLPVKVALFFLLHCYRIRATSSPGQLLLDAFMYHVWAAVAYIVMRVAMWTIDKTADGLRSMTSDKG